MGIEKTTTKITHFKLTAAQSLFWGQSTASKEFICRAVNFRGQQKLSAKLLPSDRKFYRQTKVSANGIINLFAGKTLAIRAHKQPATDFSTQNFVFIVRCTS
jgi:hypothetical protein